jgi:tripartite-type tricarboxylate transporter receptor subunit TctC
MLFTTPLYLVAHPSADFDMTVWFGLVAPANTPRAIIERLNREVGEILRTRELKDKFAAACVDITPSTPAPG